MKKLVPLFSALCLAVVALAAPARIADISHAELQAVVAKKSATILDANGTDSFVAGHIPGAIDFTANETKLTALLPKDKGALIVAYCGNELCSAYEDAAKAALALGYTNVKHYAPGLDGWKKSGAKLEKS